MLFYLYSEVWISKIQVIIWNSSHSLTWKIGDSWQDLASKSIIWLTQTWRVAVINVLFAFLSVCISVNQQLFAQLELLSMDLFIYIQILLFFWHNWTIFWMEFMSFPNPKFDFRGKCNVTSVWFLESISRPPTLVFLDPKLGLDARAFIQSFYKSQDRLCYFRLSWKEKSS